MPEVDQSQYREVKEKFWLRMVWACVNATIFRALPGTRLARYRNMLVRLFGGRVPKRCNIYNTVVIFAPWNLTVGPFSTIGPSVKIYNKSPVSIGANATISQRTFICTASHDISCPAMSLVSRAITIDDGVWIAAECFVGPGVWVGKGAVASARSCVFENVTAWEVVRGNPAEVIGIRKLKSALPTQGAIGGAHESVD